MKFKLLLAHPLFCAFNSFWIRFRPRRPRQGFRDQAARRGEELIAAKGNDLLRAVARQWFLVARQASLNAAVPGPPHNPRPKYRG